MYSMSELEKELKNKEEYLELPFKLDRNNNITLELIDYPYYELSKFLRDSGINQRRVKRILLEVEE